MEKVQKSTATLFNRYAEVFMALRDSVRLIRGDGLGGTDLRILSFGCSIGAEMLTARTYFPDATILGCDIDEGALATAAATLIDDEGQVFLSTPEAIKTFAPYDIILVNSVLCLYPLPKGVVGLNKHFPFSKFEDLSGLLIETLAADGLFVLYNASYRFSDLDMASEFQNLLTPQIEGNGFVDKFSADGTRLTISTQHQGQRTYSHQVLSSDVTDADFRDCIFHRSQTLKSVESEIDPIGGETQLILGLNPHQMKENEIAAGLYEGILEDGTRRREWRKSTLDGSIASFGCWDTKAHLPRVQSDYFIDKRKGPKKPRLKRWFS